MISFDYDLADPALLEAWVRRNSSTGAGDPTAVVGERGLVHGLRGLRIADASIMPRVPSANTNVPTIMIGEHIGEWVREELG